MIQRYFLPSLLSVSALALSACGGSDSSSTSLANHPPTAVISNESQALPTEFTVTMGSSITLLATDSNDTDGTIESYNWSSSILSEDSSEESITLTFTEPGSVNVMLTVTDNDNASNNAIVKFNVHENIAPVANISPNIQLIEQGKLTNFSASGSSDADGEIVSYLWSNGATTETTQFSFDKLGQQTITLTVTDNDGLTDTANLPVNVTEPDPTNSAPVAAISPDTDVTAYLFKPIEFDASSSTDDKGVVSYLWSNDATTKTTQYTFDELGQQTITLKVTDQEGLTDTAEVKVTVTEHPCHDCEIPVVADITVSGELNIEPGESLTFSAKNSTGAELSYLWSNEETGQTTKINFPDAGEFKVSLTVTDNQGATNSTSATVNVASSDTEAPVVSASPAAGTYTNEQSVKLTVTDNEDSNPKLYFTTDGTSASTSSTLYTNQSITVANIVENGTDVVINTLAVDAAGNEAETSFEYTITPSGPIEFPANEFHVNCDGFYNEYSNNLRIYQVMVESFIDGDSNIGYGTGYGTSHHNGDLQGIIDSLDYIKGLGMNGLWMTPVFDSEGGGALDATGYFTRNYFKIDPKWGDMEKMRELVNKAHEKGLYVFFDGVFGHYKSGPTQSPTGKTPASTSTCLDKSGSYSAGGGTACADYGQSQTLEYFQEVAAYWIKELKIDGWRLDQAYQVPISAWRDIRKTVVETSNSVTYTNSEGQTVHPLGYMVAEIWDGGGEYVQSKAFGTESNRGLCSAFDFPLRYSLIQSYAGEEWSESNGKKDLPMTNVVSGYEVANSYPSNARPNLMITNHDLVRIGDLLQRAGIAQPGDNEYWLRHKALFGFMGAYTGPITLYYGDELGQEVADFARMEVNERNECNRMNYCDDHVSRDSARIEGVNHSASGNEKELRDFITKLMTIRSQEPALHSGDRTHLDVGDSATIYADLKQKDGDTILFITNKSNDTKTVSVSTSQMQASGTLTDLVDDSTVSESSGNYSISLAPWQVRYLKAN